MGKLLLVISLISGIASAQVVTGAAIVAGLKVAADDVMKNADRVGKNVADRMRDNLLAVSSDLSRQLKEDLEKPISELTQSLRLVAMRANAMLDTTRAMLDALVSCAAADIASIVKEVDVALSANVSSIAFWSKTTRFISSAFVLGEPHRQGLRNGRAVTLRVSATLQDLVTDCDDSLRASLKSAAGQSIPVAVVALDPRGVTLTVPAIQWPGTYVLQLQYFVREGFFKTCKSVLLDKALLVLPERTYQVEFRARASCPVKEAREQISHVRLDESDDDDSRSTQLCAEPGWSRESCGREDVTGSGCRLGEVQYLGSQCCSLSVDCHDGDNNGSKDGRLHLTQSRYVPQSMANELTGRFPSALRDGETRSIELLRAADAGVLLPAAASECDWTLSASIDGPDGHFEIPAESGKGKLELSQSGMKLEWVPMEARLYATPPPRACSFTE